MKRTDNHHTAYLIVLAFVGLFVHLSSHAQYSPQNQNLNYWSIQEQGRRNQLSQIRVDFNYIFRSRVVSDSVLSAIRDCHIINKTQNTGTVSDAYGDFKILANINDSISFSALGYEKLTIALTESMFNYGYIVKLKPSIYELDEVTIRPLVEVPLISRWEIYTPPLPNQGGINIPIGASPITALYNRFSKEGKQKKYYEKLLEGTHDFVLIGEKFNGELVAQITGLKDDELVKFMSFCNFSKDFLMNYSPATINRAIRQKYQEYSERL